MRRRGVPCGCTDNGGCCGLKEKLAILWDRTIGSILKINDQTPDGDGKFIVQAGDNIEISNVSNGIEIGMKNPLTDDVTIQADLTVDGDIVANGDIIQNGSAYETHAEKIYTNDDYIVMREGAVGPLGAGDFSGFQVTKYDGTNDGRLVVDRDGVARVGDVGDEQPLATRDESADLTDNHLLKWDATNQKLVDTGLDADALSGMELYDENSYTSISALTPFNQYSMGLPLNTGKEFETGYDYVIVITSSDDYALNIKTGRTTETPGNTTFTIQMQAGEVATPTFVYAVYRFANGGNAPTVNLIGSCSVKLQTKLVSGTNIKTVGGQSLLGSGDVPAGGLTWTERTANNDWTDLFVADSGKIKPLKNIVIYNKERVLTYIPKNVVFPNSYIRILTTPLPSGSGNVLWTIESFDIDVYRIGSSYTNFTGTRRDITFTTDGTSITLTGTNTTSTTSKSNLKIYISD